MGKRTGAGFARRTPKLGKRGKLEKVQLVRVIEPAKHGKGEGQRITTVRFDESGGTKVAAMTSLFDGSMFPKPPKRNPTVRELDKSSGSFVERELEDDEVMHLVPARAALRRQGIRGRGSGYSVRRSPRGLRLDSVVPDDADGIMNELNKRARKASRLGRKPKGATRYGIR
jgi:hypothetical protein